MTYTPVMQVSCYFWPRRTFMRLHYEPWGTVQ